MGHFSNWDYFEKLKLEKRVEEWLSSLYWSDILKYKILEELGDEISFTRAIF